MLALEELLLPALVWILSLGHCLKHCEIIQHLGVTLKAVAALGSLKAMDFSPGQAGVTPKGFGLAPCGTGHSTTPGTCRYLRIWGMFFWIATHLVSVARLQALRAGCSRTPGRCPGALPRPRSCPFPTPRPPDTAPGCTTWMERGRGCASPATPEPCPGGIPLITAGMEIA